MKIYINNMVSPRHKIIVENILTELGLTYSSVGLGEADIDGPLPVTARDKLKSELFEIGLEIMDTKKSILVQKIKNIIVEAIFKHEQPMDRNLSVYLSDYLSYDYTYLANTFSQIQGISIEKFTIIQKINRVKDLLMLEDLTLTEIAFRMNYSSLSHLSRQFKKITGLTVSRYKETNKRNLL